MRRLLEYETTTLFTFLLRFNQVSKRPKRTSTKDHIINFWPTLSSDPHSDTYDKWCRVKVVLNHPFRFVEQLLQDANSDTSTWPDAYLRCVSLEHDHPDDCLPDLARKNLPKVEEEYDLAEDNLEDHGVAEDFMLLARRVNDSGGVILDRDALLGQRDIDRGYDWMANAAVFAELNREWLSEAKKLGGEDPQTYDVDGRNLQTLSPPQLEVYDVLIAHYRAALEHRRPSPLFLNVDGPAGTGRSYVIEMLSAYLAELATAHSVRDPVARAGPTGVAAFNIKGRTLHQLLKLPIKGKFERLSNERRTKFQGDFRDRRYLIIDEKSMISLKLLCWIDRRLREAFPENVNERFGGMSIILCGDFAQLPPVAGTALFATFRPSAPVELFEGRDAYHTLSHTVVLDQVMRQDGNDEENLRFKQALTELHTNSIKIPSWQLIKSVELLMQVLPPHISSAKDEEYIRTPQLTNERGYPLGTLLPE